MLIRYKRTGQTADIEQRYADVLLKAGAAELVEIEPAQTEKPKRRRRRKKGEA